MKPSWRGTNRTNSSDSEGNQETKFALLLNLGHCPEFGWPLVKEASIDPPTWFTACLFSLSQICGFGDLQTVEKQSVRQEEHTASLLQSCHCLQAKERMEIVKGTARGTQKIVEVSNTVLAEKGMYKINSVLSLPIGTYAT